MFSGRPNEAHEILHQIQYHSTFIQRELGDSICSSYISIERDVRKCMIQE